MPETHLGIRKRENYSKSHVTASRGFVKKKSLLRQVLMQNEVQRRS